MWISLSWVSLCCVCGIILLLYWVSLCWVSWYLVSWRHVIVIKLFYSLPLTKHKHIFLGKSLWVKTIFEKICHSTLASVYHCNINIIITHAEWLTEWGTLWARPHSSFSQSMDKPGNTKGGSITVLSTSCLTGLESAVWQLTIVVFIWKTD